MKSKFRTLLIVIGCLGAAAMGVYLYVSINFDAQVFPWKKFWIYLMVIAGIGFVVWGIVMLFLKRKDKSDDQRMLRDRKPIKDRVASKRVINIFKEEYARERGIPVSYAYWLDSKDPPVVLPDGALRIHGTKRYVDPERQTSDEYMNIDFFAMDGDDSGFRNVITLEVDKGEDWLRNNILSNLDRNETFVSHLRDHKAFPLSSAKSAADLYSFKMLEGLTAGEYSAEELTALQAIRKLEAVPDNGVQKEEGEVRVVATQPQPESDDDVEDDEMKKFVEGKT